MNKELDDLLDSALDDFDKKITIKDEEPNVKKLSSNVTIEHTNLYVDDIDYDDRPPVTVSSAMPKKSELKTDANPNMGFTLNDENLKIFEGIFNEGQSKESGVKDFKDMFNMFQNSKDETNLLDNFQKVMSELINEETNLDDDLSDFDNIEELNFLKNLATAATQQSKKDEEKTTTCNEEQTKTEPETEKTPMQKVLDDMNKNSEKVLKNSNSNAFPFGGDFLSSLTQGLNLDENATGDENLDSATSLMMQPILSMLFSKEILYPSLKLMLENYDKYISDKREKMTEEELKKCYDQKEYIKQMCTLYEVSSESDSKEAKAEQLKNILDLLEKCGMPPSELVPEVNPFEGLGNQMKTNGCPVS